MYHLKDNASYRYTPDGVRWDSFNDGWMSGNFTSFSTVFQLYQDDGRLIMKGCVQWSSVYG